MDNKIKEILLQLLASSSDEDDSIFEEYFTNRMSSDDSAANDSDDKDEENICNLMDIIDEYSEGDFKLLFRINRSTVEQLVKQYSQSDIFSRSQRGGKQKIGARKEFYLYIWYITNTITFRQLGNLFGIVKSSAWTAVGRVTNWLFSIGSEYIKWPQGDAFAENCRQFETQHKLTSVIGAIGCTHINIAAPKQNKDRYYNKNKNFSIILQAVVDTENKFIDICCEPGSLDDNRVLRISALYKKAQTDYDQLFPCNTYLLGDSEYTATRWLVQPYKDNDQLTDGQRSYNNLHSAARMVVERTFELLKRRFTRLNTFTEQRNISSVEKMIVSACILHNLCIINNDQYTVMSEEENSICSDVETNSENGLPIDRRQVLFDHMCQQNKI